MLLTTEQGEERKAMKDRWWAYGRPSSDVLALKELIKTDGCSVDVKNCKKEMMSERLARLCLLTRLKARKGLQCRRTELTRRDKQVTRRQGVLQ